MPQSAQLRGFTVGGISATVSPHVSGDQLSQDLASLKIDRGVKPPSGSSKIVVVAALLAALALIGAFVVYPRARAQLFTSEVKLGEVALISPAQAQVQLTATGYVVALIYAKVASKVAGRIAEIFVEEGQTIEKGSKVARLEDVDFKTQLATARAHAAAARARVAVARASLAELKVQIDRNAPLVELGAVAKATLDDLKTRDESASASIQAALAEAAEADAAVQALEVQLGSYEIITPISGTVVDKLVKVGEGVSPGFGTPGVIEVIDLTSLVVEVDVPETRLSQVAIDGPCEIVLDAAPTTRFRGAVKEIGRRVNRSKATVPVKIRFVDRPALPSGSAASPGGAGLGASPAGMLDPKAAKARDSITVLPDMAARVSFLSEALDPAQLATPPKLVVPTAAVVQRHGSDVVFVFDDGQVRMTAVKAGAPAADGRELETKLPPGTKVVLDPPAELTEGQNVKEKKL